MHCVFPRSSSSNQWKELTEGPEESPFAVIKLISKEDRMCSSYILEWTVPCSFLLLDSNSSSILLYLEGKRNSFNLMHCEYSLEGSGGKSTQQEYTLQTLSKIIRSAYS